MSRADRGKGPRPVYRTPLARFLLSRDRRQVRARTILATSAAAVTALGLSLVPRGDLHAPVLVAMEGSGPSIALDNLSVLLSEQMPEPEFEPVAATFAGLDARRLGQAVDAVRREVSRGAFPGAALVVGRGSSVVQKAGLGVTAPAGRAVDADGTIYDLASLTKVVATTTAVMLLVEDGTISLDDPVAKHLPEFTGGSKPRVTIRQLLTHTSGLPAGTGLPPGTPEVVLRRLVSTPLKWRPGTRVVYSDIGPIVLWAAAERAAGEPLEKLLDRRVFAPLGMKSTRFRPVGPCIACAPTTGSIHGRVHDPLAQRLGGVAGNAGLFASASDIGRFAAMLANGGELGGVRVLKEETIREFTRRQPGAATRALGWDTPNDRGTGAGGGRMSSKSFGHTGFTGTSLWIDAERKTWAVLLTNRTYEPRGRNGIQALRRTVNNHLAEAADLAQAD